MYVHRNKTNMVIPNKDKVGLKNYKIRNCSGVDYTIQCIILKKNGHYTLKQKLVCLVLHLKVTHNFF